MLGPVIVAAAQVYFDQLEHCCLQDLELEVGLQDLELDFELQDPELDLWDLTLHPQIDPEH